ncbi:MAG: MutS family DNA mismatch repair protein [Nitrospiraceae bacterium]
MSIAVQPKVVWTREQTIQRLIARVDRLLERAGRISARFTRWRLAIFVAGVVCSVIPYKLQWYHLGNAAMGSFLIIFLIVARYHSRLENRMHRLRLWRDIKHTHLARLKLNWQAIPARTTPAPDAHPYATDLDITGPHSLFSLLNTTVSSNGRDRLAAWLLNQPYSQTNWPTHWLARQSLVKEMASLPLFRDRLVLEASLIGKAEIDGHRIHAALQVPAAFSGLVPVLVIETILAAGTWVLALASALGAVPSYWTLSFGAYAIIYMLISGQTAPIFGRALSLHHELEKLGAVFRYLECRSYAVTPQLGRLCAPLTSGARRPSEYIRRFARVCQALSVRAHPLVHLVLNAAGPWDLWWIFRFQRLHKQVLPEIPTWLDKLAELEAASALGNFAYLNPAYHWPSLLSPAGNGRPATITAQALGHPLIPAAQRVTNDLNLWSVGRILIITGSNMSGKSTFLRTLGINTCLAQAGAPVCAASFEWTWVRISCCIRVDDSLEAGLSFFYAEVKRLKRLLDEARDRSAPPVLFLIDEIFKGTNNRERLIGSRSFVKALAGSNGFGLITTHDLELAELEKEIPNAANAHFRETVEANELRFDYRLRHGPCPTTNALRIMALEGLPVPEGKD